MNQSPVHGRSPIARVRQHPLLVGSLCALSVALAIYGVYLLQSGSWVAATVVIVFAVGICDALTWLAGRRRDSEDGTVGDSEPLARYPALFAKTRRLALIGFVPPLVIVSLWVLSVEWGWIPAAIGTAMLLPIWLLLFVMPLHRLRHEPLA